MGRERGQYGYDVEKRTERTSDMDSGMEKDAAFIVEMKERKASRTSVDGRSAVEEPAVGST